MPVIIKDFEVAGNGDNGQEPAVVRPAPQPAQRPVSARELARILKQAKERAKRLHAD